MCRLEEEVEEWAYLSNSDLLDVYVYIKGVQTSHLPV